VRGGGDGRVADRRDRGRYGWSMTMQNEDKSVYFCLSIDCEATQPAIRDRDLGERAAGGVADLMEEHEWRATFLVIPTDIEASGALYRELRQRGHEVGLHLHPAAQGYEEFLGIYSASMQKRIIGEAVDRFAEVMGDRPKAFCAGYASANDYTYPVLTELGLEHGICSSPGRVLPECAAVWAGSPLFVHYANGNNRVLAGDLDFVEIPGTCDWESKMWGGKHPQDLRIELVDSKNHFYTIQKCLKRQIDEAQPIKVIHPVTHNVFEYGKADDFRRQTLEGVIRHYERLTREASCEPACATLAEVAEMYRGKVERTTCKLELDRRGYLEGD